MGKRIIVGLHVSNRVEGAPRIQQILTEYGGNIRTRLGLHPTGSEESSSGLILLETVGDELRIQEMENRLRSIEGVTVKRMEFED